MSNERTELLDLDSEKEVQKSREQLETDAETALDSLKKIMNNVLLGYSLDYDSLLVEFVASDGIYHAADKMTLGMLCDDDYSINYTANTLARLLAKERYFK